MPIVFTPEQAIFFMFFSIVFFLGACIASRKHIHSIFDPLLYVCGSVAINIAVVLSAPDVTLEVCFYMASCYCAFFGAIFIVRTSKPRVGQRPPLAPSRFTTLYLISVCLVCYLAYDVFFIQKAGWGIAGDTNPDLIKVSVTQGGNGIFFRFNWLANLLLLPLLVHLLVYYREWLIGAVVLLFFVVQNTLFSFSKSGFILAVFDVGILALYYYQVTGRNIIKRSLMLKLAALGALPAVLVLCILANKYAISPLDLLITRISVTGLGSYEYFASGGDQAFNHLGFDDRLLLYFDNLLSPMRLKEWEPLTYPALMKWHLTGNWMPGYGANPFLFMDGHFLFSWAGSLYCFALGFVCIKIRNLRIELLTYYVLVKSVLFMIADPGVAMMNVIAMIFFIPALIPLLFFQMAGYKLWVPLKWAAPRPQKQTALPTAVVMEPLR